MLNQVIIVGNVDKIETKNDCTVLTLTVESPRDEVIRDIPLKIGKGLMKSMEYIKVGTTLGAKAHVNMDNGIVEIVAEKLTFISSKEDS